jgi:Lrp/AsnC family leucine-responsive transcriptional regulator
MTITGKGFAPPKPIVAMRHVVSTEEGEEAPMSQIDTIDDRILAALQENGRLTMKALAEKVGLSSPAMIERVRRLEDRGVISGYRAIVNPAALGRGLTAFVSVTVEHANQDAFLQAVDADQAICECHRVAGASSHLVRANLADPADLAHLLDRLSATGAHCEPLLVLDSPLPWRATTPPSGGQQERNRPARRRRKPTPALQETAIDEAPAAPRRPGRPRGRRTTS